MRILVHSYVFWPSVGGIERVSEVLCHQFVAMGHRVTLVTWSEIGAEEVHREFAYGVIRRPGILQLLQLAREHDVLWQNNISLPLLMISRPFIPTVITMQTWIGNRPDASDWKTRIKQACHRVARTVAISQAIASVIPGNAIIIPNPFDGKLFQPAEYAPGTLDNVKERAVLFVGRLVSDKGVDLLLDAMTMLPSSSRPRLTIVGTGPELPRLQARALKDFTKDTVCFLGALQGRELKVQYQRHAVVAIPSRWPEPLGIVALEAISSGCLVVAANHGGLPDAVGKCGLLFPAGNAQGLAEALLQALHDPTIHRQFADNANAHLERFREENVATQYLELFAQVSGQGG